MSFLKLLSILHIMNDIFCRFTRDKIDELMNKYSRLMLVRLCEEVRRWKLLNCVWNKVWFFMFRIFKFCIPAENWDKEWVADLDFSITTYSSGPSNLCHFDDPFTFRICSVGGIKFKIRTSRLGTSMLYHFEVNNTSTYRNPNKISYTNKFVITYKSLSLNEIFILKLCYFFSIKSLCLQFYFNFNQFTEMSSIILVIWCQMNKVQLPFLLNKSRSSIFTLIFFDLHLRVQ